MGHVGLKSQRDSSEASGHSETRVLRNIWKEECLFTPQVGSMLLTTNISGNTCLERRYTTASASCPRGKVQSQRKTPAAHRLHPHNVRTYSKLQTERQQFIGTVPNNECPSGQSCAIWCGQSEFTWKCLSLEGKTISREDIVCSSVLLLWSALERFKQQHLFSTPSFSSSTPSLRYKSILNTYLVMTAAQRESAPALEPSFDNLLRSNGVDEDIIMAFRVRGVLDRELIVCSFRFNRRGGS